MDGDQHQPVLIEAYDDEIEARRSPSPPRSSQLPLPPPDEPGSDASTTQHSRDSSDADRSSDSDGDDDSLDEGTCCSDGSKRSAASFREDDSAGVTAGLLKVVDHTYRDFSGIPADGKSVSATSSASVERTFPLKLHEVLSKKEYCAYISWMSHGRAFRVHGGAKRFEAMVCVKIFKSCRYHAFLRNLNNWGFKRITQGRDRDCYYHEAFLYGLPHLTRYITLEKNRPLMTPVPKNEPDFYQMNALCPLPYLPNGSQVPVAPHSEPKSGKVWPPEMQGGIRGSRTDPLYSQSSANLLNGASQLTSLLDAKLRGRAARSYAPSNMEGHGTYASAGTQRSQVYAAAGSRGCLDGVAEDVMATKTLHRTDATAYSDATLNERGIDAVAGNQQMGACAGWQGSMEEAAKDSMSGKTPQCSSAFGTDYLQSHVKKKFKCAEDDANTGHLSIAGVRRNGGDDGIDTYYLANLYGSSPSHQMMFDRRQAFASGGGSLFYGNSSAVGGFGGMDGHGVGIGSMPGFLGQKAAPVSRYSGTLYGASSLGQNNGAPQDTNFSFSIRGFERKMGSQSQHPEGM